MVVPRGTGRQVLRVPAANWDGRVAISCPPWRPAECIPGNPDQRHLGVPVYSGPAAAARRLGADGPRPGWRRGRDAPAEVVPVYPGPDDVGDVRRVAAADAAALPSGPTAAPRTCTASCGSGASSPKPCPNGTCSGRAGGGWGSPSARSHSPPCLASYGCEIVATDMPEEDARRNGWAGPTNEHAANLEVLNKAGLCEPDEFRRLVTFRFEDMNAIPPDLRDFDFCWSACSIEHLGSIEKGMRFIDRMLGCLKPGGVAVHTTEFNLLSDTCTVDDAATVIFRRRDILEMQRRVRAAGHHMEVDFDPGDQPADCHIDAPPYLHDPHLKVLLHNHVSTSIGLIIEKEERRRGAVHAGGLTRQVGPAVHVLDRRPVLRPARLDGRQCPTPARRCTPPPGSRPNGTCPAPCSTPRPAPPTRPAISCPLAAGRVHAGQPGPAATGRASTYSVRLVDQSAHRPCRGQRGQAIKSM